jgi:hypothetical protein
MQPGETWLLTGVRNAYQTLVSSSDPTVSTKAIPNLKIKQFKINNIRENSVLSQKLSCATDICALSLSHIVSAQVFIAKHKLSPVNNRQENQP